MLVSLSLATPQKRLNKEAFLKLAKQAQKRYLETYPRSKHRYLLNGGKKPKINGQPKNARLPKAEPAKLRKLSRTEYSALDEKGKKRYNERFPKSGHVPRFRKGRKDMSKKRVDGKESRKEAGQRRAAEGVKVDKQRNTMHDEGAGTINKQSVMALSNIRPEQLKQGATNINNNRDEIHGLVDQEMQRRPNLYGRGLASVRDMMQGGMLDDDVIDGEYEEVDDDSQAEDKDGSPLHDEEGKPISKKQKRAAEDDAGPDPSLDDDDEEQPRSKKKKRERSEETDEERKKRKKKKKKKKGKDEKKKRDGMAVLTAVAKFALLGAGVALLAIGAGPLGMVIGRGLMDMWSSIESNAASSPEKTQEELDHDTVEEILTQTTSYMKNMDLNDLHQSSQHLFKAIAAHDPNIDIYNECFSTLLPLVKERPKGRPGKNFFGSSNVNVDTMADALKRRLTELKVLDHFDHVDDEHDECYMFFCNDKKRTLVALGATNTHGLYHVAFLNW